MTHAVTNINGHTVTVTGPYADRVAEFLSAAALMSDLLGEVSAAFTREDDLPDGLLGRIDGLLMQLPY